MMKMCCSPTVLIYYNIQKDVKTECDTSKDWPEVLLQCLKVVAYTSHALIKADKHSQLEKETLSIFLQT